MSSGGDSDTHREHFGVSQTKQAKKKKSRRPIDPEDIAGSISFAPERINHDTHLFVALPSRRYEDLPLQAIHRARPLSACTPSPTCISPQLSAMRIGDSRSEQSDAMAGTPSLTHRFMHPDVSPSSIATPSATPDDMMPSLATGQKDRLGRVMIKSDGSSWHPAKDAARALKDCVRRLYTQAYHFWSEISNSIRQAMFNNFKTMCTWDSRYNLVIWTTFERKAFAILSSWLKKVRDSGERPGWMLPHVFDELGAKMVGIIAREMEKELGRTPIEPEVFKKTHVRKKENESDPNVWVEERAERTFSGLECIGSSRRAEALDGVQITAMSDQIAKLTATLAESERRRVAEQESMCETVQQIKEQVMNHTRRPTTSAPTTRVMMMIM
ncbi:hypothetical protein MTR67_001002 [Solanum verrucosum]|uniref:Uncharacterized protein n=1 Tax=Solanum verrucosum TaxID=315347 RepID=A0AAF0PMT3_SOLVR|nr:hypothetical protein MTR67_001002 [Solanum verrucosum]